MKVPQSPVAMEMLKLCSARHQQLMSYDTTAENTSATRASVERSSHRPRTLHYNASEEQRRSTGPERGLTIKSGEKWRNATLRDRADVWKSRDNLSKNVTSLAAQNIEPI